MFRFLCTRQRWIKALRPKRLDHPLCEGPWPHPRQTGTDGPWDNPRARGLPLFVGPSAYERIPQSCTPLSTGVCGLTELGDDLSAVVLLLHNRGLLNSRAVLSERPMLVPAVIRSRRPHPKLGWREKGEGRNLPGPPRADPFTFQIHSTPIIGSGNLSSDVDRIPGARPWR